MIKVLFVCTANICRSPLAEAIFRRLVEERALSERISVSSAGTTDWRAGEPADPRSQAEALRHGLDLSHHQARQIALDDFRNSDYIVGMDEHNLYDLDILRPPEFMGWIGLLLEHAPEVHEIEVPDPYTGGPGHFAQTFDLIETGARHLLDNIVGH